MSELVIVTGPDQKPKPHPWYGDSYERGQDPWHADAFAGIPGMRELGTTGERKEGWFLIDGHGNAIGFTPDGTPIGVSLSSQSQAMILMTKGNEEAAADSQAFTDAVADQKSSAAPEPFSGTSFAQPTGTYEPILQYFDYSKLPQNEQMIAVPFWHIANNVIMKLPRNPERTVALRAQLDSLTAALRCLRGE